MEKKHYQFHPTVPFFIGESSRHLQALSQQALGDSLPPTPVRKAPVLTRQIKKLCEQK